MYAEDSRLHRPADEAARLETRSKAGRAPSEGCRRHILVANMCLTIATATSTTVRARVMEFLTEINSSYMDIRFVDTGLGVEVPEEWTENYYPSYIPDDYVLQFAHSVARNSEAEYVNARDEILRIGVYSTMATVINTEKAKITHTTLHGSSSDNSGAAI